MTTSADQVASSTRIWLWATGPGADTVPVGQQVGDRYEVIAPQIWRDTLPAAPPQAPAPIPEEALPYLKAHPHRLHVPGIYDIVPQPEGPLLLLENAAINPRTGEPLPTLQESWSTASTVRQLSWLWQLWQLWQPLLALGVAASLLTPDNIRVEGWRVRLLQLLPDGDPPAPKALVQGWQTLMADSPSAADPELRALCDRALAEAMSPDEFATQLNHRLLQAAAQTRFEFRVAGATHAGPQQSRNEDACYPDGEATEQAPRIAIVCDGVGGHEAGEVASRIAVKSLRLQIEGLLAEAYQEQSIISPQGMAKQIAAAIRVVNDLVNAQNDAQHRSDRQRMGTTLVMAVIIPQKLQTPQGWRLVDELYIAHVGDSRAYWITPDYCHPLTVDDDIAARETIAARSLPATLRDQPAAGALTQAIGTRDNSYLTPHVQRFILDEPGVLLLCSDGLSDNQRVEAAWGNYIGLIIKEIISLPSAVASWIELANQKNGHDNVSVVLLQAQPIAEGEYEPEAEPAAPGPPAEDLTDASRALLYEEESQETDPAPPEAAPEPEPETVPRWWVAAVAVLIVVLAGFVGWWVAGRLAPSSPPSDPELRE